MLRCSSDDHEVFILNRRTVEPYTKWKMPHKQLTIEQCLHLGPKSDEFDEYCLCVPDKTHGCTVAEISIEVLFKPL